MKPPEAKRPREIVVRGSAGRSSTAAMIALLLQGCGQRTGRLDAAFLHSPLERLSIDTVPIEQEALQRLLALHAGGDTGEDQGIEAIADRYVEQEGVDWLICTGPSARSTAPLLDVWMPVFPSHEASAAEEARRLASMGALAPAAVTAPQRESVLDVLRAACPALEEVAQRCAMARGRSDLDGQELRLRTPRAEYRLRLPVLGRFQLENAAVAILAVEQLQGAGVSLSPAIARAALGALRLPGRLELIRRRPAVVIDAAQRAESLRRLIESLRDLFSARRAVVVLSVAAGSDASAVVRALESLQPELILTAEGSSATEACSAVARAADAAGLGARQAPDVPAAVEEALSEAGPGDVVCVTGSRKAAAVARAWVLGLVPPVHDLP